MRALSILQLVAGSLCIVAAIIGNPRWDGRWRFEERGDPSFRSIMLVIGIGLLAGGILTLYLRR